MQLSCEEVRQAIPLLLDDELDPEYALELEEHLGTCDTCRDELEYEGRLRLTLRRAAASITAPPALRRRLHAALEEEHRRRSPWVKMWPAAAAAAILLAFIWKGAAGGFGTNIDQLLLPGGNVDHLPMDVVAADVAPVQRYLRARLPFALQLPRPAEHVATSLGGRIIRLQNREAAYVRYDTPRGQVSVIVYEDPEHDAIPEIMPGYFNHRVQLARVRGYTAARWRSHGLVYSVVTDLPERDITWLLRSARQSHP